MPLEEAKREHLIPWNWRYRHMRVTMWVLGTKSQSSKSNKCSLQHPSPVRYKCPVPSAPLTDFCIHLFLRSGDAVRLSPACLLVFLQHQHSFLEMAAGMTVSLPDLSCALRKWLLSSALICCGSIGIHNLHLFSCTDRLQWKLGSHDWGTSRKQGGEAVSGCSQSEPVALTERLRLSG